jgi:serralysin
MVSQTSTIRSARLSTPERGAGRPSQMARRFTRRVLATVAVAAVAVTALGAGASSFVGTPAAAHSHTPSRPAGPPYEFTRALVDGRQVGKPLTGVAIINRTQHGYVFRAGSQNNRLTVTQVRGGLRFVDPGTPRWRRLAPACRNVPARKGVAAVCKIPGGVTEEMPLMIEVWPRIGDDYLNTSALPATFVATMLGDLGDDVAIFGPGADFFNGHSGRDIVRGGGGDDWIRGGDDNDPLFGGPGNDWIVGMNGDDVIRGGSGDDHLDGLEGNDLLFGGPGRDRVACGLGIDLALIDASDSSRDCESVQVR